MKTDIYKIKTDQAWNRLYNRLDNDRLLAKVDEGHHTRKYSQWIRYGAVAAVLIGVIWGTLYWVTGSDKELAQHLLTQENQGVSTLATTLEDGSVVLLAKETSLLYPKHFIADKREVSLQGNAFFDVAKKQGQPFWIDTEQAKIEVLGTAFSVQSDENAPFRLSVQRGIVKVTLKKGNQELENWLRSLLSKNADFAQSLIPDFGLNKLFQTNSTTIAIFLAAAVAVLIWVVLNKTTFGYELKAVGLNKNAARYAGINEKKNIILSMAIAGALAGFGAGLFYLSNVSQWNPLNSTSLPGMGFNGISVALLASSNPIGTVFSALFISHISVGGSFLSTKFYPTEISDLISGIIIYLCAFSMLFRGKIQKLLFKNADKTNVNAEPAPAEKANAKKEGK